MNVSKVDLHVHSKYSDRPSSWFLQRAGLPECFTSPKHIYTTCRERGMNFITISDHNRIEGALEIAHLPSTFISSEITTYFPEDRCKIHCLVSFINESQFKDILELRSNIYELQKYLISNNIVHSIAHPLYRINDKLTLEHLEKLIVLFKRFELINGMRNDRSSELTRAILSNITKDDIYCFANKYDLEPAGEKPWIKCFTGGSDDHSGLFIANSWTEVEYSPNVEDLKRKMQEGLHNCGGKGGGSIKLATSLYHILYNFYSYKFKKLSNNSEIIERAINRIVGIENSRRTIFQKIKYKLKYNKLTQVEKEIVVDFLEVIRQVELDQFNDRSDDLQKIRFKRITNIYHKLAVKYLNKLSKSIEKGNLIKVFQNLSTLATISVGVTPYFTAFGVQYKDEPALKEIANGFQSSKYLAERNDKKLWITDTFNEVNGVATTIKELSTVAAGEEKNLTVAVCYDVKPRVSFPIKCFKPIGSFAAPAYRDIQINIPPFFEVFQYIEENEFSELIISTPGPLGVCALIAGKMLGLKITGIYHTAFPEYIKTYTKDDTLENLTWAAMKIFYQGMDFIYAPSQSFVEVLHNNGFDKDKLGIIGRGVDRSIFNEKFKCKLFWKEYGLKDEFIILYVGRLSKEKNIHSLIEPFKLLSKQRSDIALCLVGSGPYEKELKKLAANNKNIVFTGVLNGKNLSTAYASSNLFVFPSNSDTFGNVVLEANSSGLPAIVSNKGGPKEIVNTHGSGIVIDCNNTKLLRDKILYLIEDSVQYNILKQSAINKAEDSNWKKFINFL